MQCFVNRLHAVHACTRESTTDLVVSSIVVHWAQADKRLATHLCFAILALRCYLATATAASATNSHCRLHAGLCNRTDRETPNGVKAARASASALQEIRGRGRSATGVWMWNILGCYVAWQLLFSCWEVWCDFLSLRRGRDIFVPPSCGADVPFRFPDRYALIVVVSTCEIFFHWFDSPSLLMQGRRLVRARFASNVSWHGVNLEYLAPSRVSLTVESPTILPTCSVFQGCLWDLPHHPGLLFESCIRWYISHLLWMSTLDFVIVWCRWCSSMHTPLILCFVLPSRRSSSLSMIVITTMAIGQ